MCRATAGAGAAMSEIVTLGLARQQPVERLVDRGGAAGAEQVPQLDLLVVAEAAEDGARSPSPGSGCSRRRNCLSAA